MHEIMRHKEDIRSVELLNDYEQFKRKLFRRTGLNLNCYKFDQTYRRIWDMVERAQFERFTDYFDYLQENERHMRSFVDRLAINVSELFRNPEQFQVLRTRALPMLLKQKRALKIWSAGCSYGAEAYSLAILLNEIAPEYNHSILGTDIDQSALERALEGYFDQADMKNTPLELRLRYFREYKRNQKTAYEASPLLRKYLRFETHNLLSDRFDNNFDLIVCRNVVIYFADQAKDQVFRDFYTALNSGGYLFVGSSERIFNYRAMGFTNPDAFFYYKP